MRQPILYAVETWRRQRYWPLLFIAAGVLVTALQLVQKQAPSQIDRLSLLIYIPGGLLYGLALILYRRRSYVRAEERGLRVSTLRASALIGYDHVRWAKVQALRSHFQSPERRRLLRPGSQALLERPAVFVRLNADQGQLQLVSKKLGKTIVDGDLLAVPVPDPDALCSELMGRLPERTAANLGGQRRGRRRHR